MSILGGTLVRYFGLRFLSAVLLVFAGIFVLVALLDYIELMRRSSDIPNVSAILVAKTSFYRVPQVTERVMPFCMLIGAMSCYLNLSRRLELWSHARPGCRLGNSSRRQSWCHSLGIFATTIYNPVAAVMEEQSKRSKRSCSARPRARTSTRRSTMGQPENSRWPGDHQRQCQPQPRHLAHRRDRFSLMTPTIISNSASRPALLCSSREHGG